VKTLKHGRMLEIQWVPTEIENLLFQPQNPFQIKKK